MFLKNTLTIFFLLFTLYSIPVFSATAEESDDFWLLEDYKPLQNALWLYAGIDEENGGYYGLNTELSLSTSLRFNLKATQENYSFRTDDLSWGFSGDVGDQFSWGIYHANWGNKNTLQKNDLGFVLAYFNKGFSSRLGYETGEVELFFEQSNVQQIDSVRRGHRATELSLAYSWVEFYTELRHKQHDYYKVNQANRVRRSVILNFASSIGLQQARNLADSESSVLLGAQLNDARYEILLSQIDSAFSSNKYSYISLSLVKSLSPQLQLGANMEIPLDDGLLTAGLSLGYMW